MRCLGPPKSKILSVTHISTEGRWATTKIPTLPGEWPSALDRCASHADSPKQHSNVFVTGRGPADEAVVVVKPRTDEDVVTHLRRKLPESGSNAGGEGRNT